MGEVFHIDTRAVFAHRVTLDQINRSAFPVAVRQTLNSAALNVKTSTMPKEAKADFIKREPNFFRANSTAILATGFDVDTMHADVGFIASSGLSNNHAIDELQQQEDGGSISGRSFIPIDAAREGGSNKKKVRPNEILANVKNIIDAKNAAGVNKGQQFIKSAIFAGAGGLVLGEYKGRQILWRVNSLDKNEEGGMKLSPLYTYEHGRSTKPIKATHFMATASNKTATKMPQIFEKHATKRIAREVKNKGK